MILARRHLPFAAIGLLAACSSPPAPSPFDTSQVTTIRLAVQNFDVRPEAEQKPDWTFIDRRRSQELSQATEQFLRQRFVAAGGADNGAGIIEEASIVTVPRELSRAQSMLPGQVTADVTGTLGVRIVISDATGVERSFASARVQIKRELTGGSVPAQDAFAQQLMRNLIDALSGSIETSVEQNLANYIAL